jgi:hypothetical protein
LEGALPYPPGVYCVVPESDGMRPRGIIS